MLTFGEWIGLAGFTVVIITSMVHITARFTAIETKLDLLYESFKKGMLQPYEIRTKTHGD